MISPLNRKPGVTVDLSQPGYEGDQPMRKSRFTKEARIVEILGVRCRDVADSLPGP